MIVGAIFFEIITLYFAKLCISYRQRWHATRKYCCPGMALAFFNTYNCMYGHVPAWRSVFEVDPI
jgi:hypothetical protein